MPERSRYRRTLLEYKATVPHGTVAAYDEVPLGQARSSHRSLAGLHSQHLPVHDRGPATATTRSVCDDATHHRQYSSRYDTATPITSSSHPFLAAHERLSKMYLESNRLLVRGPLP